MRTIITHKLSVTIMDSVAVTNAVKRGCRHRWRNDIAALDVICDECGESLAYLKRGVRPHW